MDLVSQDKLVLNSQYLPYGFSVSVQSVDIKVPTSEGSPLTSPMTTIDAKQASETTPPESISLSNTSTTDFSDFSGRTQGKDDSALDSSVMLTDALQNFIEMDFTHPLLPTGIYSTGPKLAPESAYSTYKEILQHNIGDKQPSQANSEIVAEPSIDTPKSLETVPSKGRTASTVSTLSGHSWTTQGMSDAVRSPTLSAEVSSDIATVTAITTTNTTTTTTTVTSTTAVATPASNNQGRSSSGSPVFVATLSGVTIGTVTVSPEYSLTAGELLNQNIKGLVLVNNQLYVGVSTVAYFPVVMSMPPAAAAITTNAAAAAVPHSTSTAAGDSGALGKTVPSRIQTSYNVSPSVAQRILAPKQATDSAATKAPMTATDTGSNETFSVKCLSQSAESSDVSDSSLIQTEECDDVIFEPSSHTPIPEHHSHPLNSTSKMVVVPSRKAFSISEGLPNAMFLPRVVVGTCDGTPQLPQQPLARQQQQHQLQHQHQQLNQQQQQPILQPSQPLQALQHVNALQQAQQHRIVKANATAVTVEPSTSASNLRMIQFHHQHQMQLQQHQMQLQQQEDQLAQVEIGTNGSRRTQRRPPRVITDDSFVNNNIMVSSPWSNVTPTSLPSPSVATIQPSPSARVNYSTAFGLHHRSPKVPTPDASPSSSMSGLSKSQGNINLQGFHTAALQQQQQRALNSFGAPQNVPGASLPQPTNVMHFSTTASPFKEQPFQQQLQQQQLQQQQQQLHQQQQQQQQLQQQQLQQQQLQQQLQQQQLQQQQLQQQQLQQQQLQHQQLLQQQQLQLQLQLQQSKQQTQAQQQLQFLQQQQQRKIDGIHASGVFPNLPKSNSPQLSSSPGAPSSSSSSPPLGDSSVGVATSSCGATTGGVMPVAATSSAAPLQATISVSISSSGSVPVPTGTVPVSKLNLLASMTPSQGQMCEHQEYWKRQRTKKGFGHYVCLFCGAKWRMKNVVEGNSPPSGGNPGGLNPSGSNDSLDMTEQEDPQPQLQSQLQSQQKRGAASASVASAGGSAIDSVGNENSGNALCNPYQSCNRGISGSGSGSGNGNGSASSNNSNSPPAVALSTTSIVSTSFPIFGRPQQQQQQQQQQQLQQQQLQQQIQPIANISRGAVVGVPSTHPLIIGGIHGSGSSTDAPSIGVTTLSGASALNWRS